jgi:hypothetical protein
MQTLNRLESDLGSIETAVQMLNQDFCWDINIVEVQKKLVVKSGDTVIFSCDSNESLEAFLYGMGLSIKGIPEPYFSQLRKVMREWCDNQ